jgi:hypothetical protein
MPVCSYVSSKAMKIEIMAGEFLLALHNKTYGT